ncbi:variable large family protein (plasmid) [Borreliella andersonii]|uniref:Variable large family protein n=1 Tax=Borrelia andersonii TaxID=42109 RepID=A0ACD5G6A2_BORAD
MGHGFVDVFNAIGGLISDVFYKADPKKSDVKNYFESIAKILKDTQTKLDALSKEQGGGDGGTQVVDAAVKASGWIKEMHKAVEDIAKAGTGGGEPIANVAAGGAAGAAAGAGAMADAGSVTGIAKGMKAIVDAAGKAGGWIKEMHKAVEDTAKAGEGDGESIANVAAGGDAGAGADNDANNAQKAAAEAGKAVSAVSGDQILKAIVGAAGKAGVEFKPGTEGAAGDNGDAGKLFVSGNNADNGAAADAAQKAAAEAGKAVSAVSGDQILKAIVGAAEKNSAGKRANAATNAVAAAIGEDGADEAAAFVAVGMRKNDQIAAAIVLRGLVRVVLLGLLRG